MFPRLKERRRNGGRQLSGGEQQMLAIGRALVLNPSLLLLRFPHSQSVPPFRAGRLQGGGEGPLGHTQCFAKCPFCQFLDRISD